MSTRCDDSGSRPQLAIGKFKDRSVNYKIVAGFSPQGDMIVAAGEADAMRRSLPDLSVSPITRSTRREAAILG